MSTWQATPRGKALAQHARRQVTKTPCPDTCPICSHIEWEAQQFANDLDQRAQPSTPNTEHRDTQHVH